MPIVPDYEQLLENFYRTLLKPGDVAIDAGAHTGRHTLPIARATAPGGRVFAFEPLPFARAQLDKAVAAGAAAVSVYPYALADREGEDEFVVAVDLPAYSGLKTRIAEFWRGKPFAIFDILGRRLEPEQLIESAVRQDVWDYVALPVLRAEAILKEWNARR